MALPLHILLPGATIAVLILSLFIWWITGTRNQAISEPVIIDYLDRYYPGLKIAKIIVNDTAGMGIVKLAGNKEVRLIRPLGNRLVDQSFDINALKPADSSEVIENLHFPRQGIAFPPADFQIRTDALSSFLAMETE